MLQKVVQCVAPFKPELFLQNIMSTIQDKDKNHIVVHISTVVRLLYAQLWTCKEVLNEDKLKDKIYEAAEMDILSEKK